MNNKELICRALVGDKQAQELCTAKGIVLPCPCCKGESYTETFFECKGWKTVIGCSDCPISLVTITYDSEEKAQQKALKDWNTRPAPPIGRCGECRNWNGGDCYRQELTKADDFCSYFEPREE